MSAKPDVAALIRDARGRAAIVGRGTGTGKAYLDLADGLVELQRRAEAAEAKLLRVRASADEWEVLGRGVWAAAPDLAKKYLDTATNIRAAIGVDS